MWKTVGQQRIIALLEHNIKNREPAHAYLIIGPPHVGKMTLAIDFVQAINCEGNQPPCKECQTCKKIAEGKHADVVVIEGTEDASSETKAGSEIGIDEIKTLQHSASLPPYEGRYKVFIINGAESLSHEAANCLLKTLEEPPPHVIFVLLTSSESQVLPTIISRCQRLELKPLASEEVSKILTTLYGLDDQKARLLSGLAQGCPGWAINAVLDSTVLAQRAQFIEEMFSLLEATWGERLTYAAKLAANRTSAEQALRNWLSCWRDIMLIKNGYNEAVVNLDYLDTLVSLSQRLNIGEVRRFIESIWRSLAYTATNANLRLIMEVALLNMPRLKNRAEASWHTSTTSTQG